MRREEEVGSGKKKNEEKVSRKEVGSMHLAKEMWLFFRCRAPGYL